MRILVVTSQFPLAGDRNRGRPIVQTVRALSRLATVRVLNPVATYAGGLRPGSYTYCPPEGADVDGCDVRTVAYPALPLLSRPLNGWLAARTLHVPLAAFAPDVVLAYWLYPDAFAAMLAARRARLPLVVGARGSDLRVRDAVSRQLTRPVLRGANQVLAVSQDLAEVAVASYGADADRVRVIPNGCDASLFAPRDQAGARHALGLAGDAQVVLYVGRLVAEKGLLELLAAVRQLARTHPRVQLVLAGDGPMAATLRAAAADAGAPPVTFAGPLGPEEVARWMAACDLVTLPSYSEGHPNVLVEALACGRPVVATRVGGIPEIVQADDGLLVPPRDIPALAAALGEALGRDWDRARIADRRSRSWADVAIDTLAACEDAAHEGALRA